MKTQTKNFLFILLAGAMLLSTISSALAEPNPATGLTPGVSSRRNLSTTNATSLEAIAGNVTLLDINGMSITKSWAGYYGNISGNIILADAQNNSLYEWGNGTTISGEVYAARNDSIDWSSINCSNATNIAAEETYLSQSSGDADSVTNTFNETSHPDFLVGLVNVSGCPSTNTWASGAYQTSTFHEILLADGDDKTVYTTIIDNDQVGYDGATHDFQLLVGEDGHNGDSATTAYYFFTELG